MKSTGWRSHASNYLTLLCIVLLYVLTRLFLTPFHRLFRLDDTDIQYPHAVKERIPVSWLLALGGLLPAATISLWILVTKSGARRAHATLFCLACSLLSTILITDLIKNLVGRPRPDLLARCKAAGDAPQHQLLSIDVCTETQHHLLHDGWRSFPSGHSSFSFAGLAYLSFFLAGQLQSYHTGTDLARILAALAPLLLAAVVAISRLEDYRHDPIDVTCGSLLGLLLAYLNYRRAYPPLTSSHSHRACSDIELRPMDGGFRRVGHEDDDDAAPSATAGNDDHV